MSQRNSSSSSSSNNNNNSNNSNDLSQDYNDPFIRDIVTFVAADDFQTKFESFFLQHAIKFNDNEEHQFIYYELYKEFQRMFDNELERFCKANNLTIEEFYTYCKNASELDEKANHYIQILISSAEYETFVRLMKIMKPIAEARNKMSAGAKEVQRYSSPTKKSIKDDDDDDDDNGQEMDEYHHPKAESKSNRPPRDAKDQDDDYDDYDEKSSKK